MMEPRNLGVRKMKCASQRALSRGATPGNLSMSRSQQRLGYAIAVVGCAAILLIRVALGDALGDQARTLPFVLAVIAAAWLGGLGPGLLATFLSLLAAILFVVPPLFSLRVETLADGLNAAIFLVTGSVISVLCDALRTSQRRETETQFHSLADAMPQLVWMARPDGSRFWYNQRWYEYTGASPGDFTPLNWSSYCDPAVRPRVLAKYEQAFIHGTPWEETYPLRRKDGQLRWHLSRAVPIRNGDGDVVCWFGTSTDIQKHVEAEQALKDADARKDQFMAVLAHELRNPLAPIANALQLWPFAATNQTELEHLRVIIDRQVQQLIRLVDDLLDLSRISRGKITLQRRPIDLRTLVARAVESIQPLIDAAGHTLRVATPDEPLLVDGDAARLMQVFSNVLNNAAKYSVRGGDISVCVARDAPSAVVTIRDDGPGIPAKMLEEIFEPFRQVDATLTRSHGGLGIGLWLSRQLVESHGGTIEARSQGLGHGSQFVIALPLLTAQPDEQPVVEPAHHRRESAPLPCHRILVVDDLHESADTLVGVLHSRGQDATALYDAQAAIEWILANHPEAVLLDIAMPRLDGYEVARRLRAHDELRDTVLVAVTGYGQQEDRRRAFEAGFNFHLTKPTSIGALEELLQRLPARRPMGEAATP